MDFPNDLSRNSSKPIYQYTGEGTPTPNKYALDEIYPEKFDDAAGQPSKTLFAKNARMRMVECVSCPQSQGRWHASPLLATISSLLPTCEHAPANALRTRRYFPEKDIKAYLGGEADELMFGHSVSGAGVGEDQYEVREVPDLIPASFMSAAGLT